VPASILVSREDATRHAQVMPTRVFLGWDRPFLRRAVEWLLDRRAELPGMLVVVPTAESGRRLREAMAEAAGALLSPRIATPGSLLTMAGTVSNVAADWTEQVAWVEVLEGVTDWSAYEELFPEAPETGGDWAAGLAREMVQLRRSLQDNALTLASAARRLRDTVEAGRWEALGRLEALVEKLLGSWGYVSRSRALAAGLKLPAGLSNIVLAGVVEMPPLFEHALMAWERAPIANDERCSGALRAPMANDEPCSGALRAPMANDKPCSGALRAPMANDEPCSGALRAPMANDEPCSGALRAPMANDEPCSGALRAPMAIDERAIGSDGHRPPLQLLTILIGAPPHDADGFSAIGRPLAAWCERDMPWPQGQQGSVLVVADPRQQALAALQVIAAEKSQSNEVALGAADAEAGGELARALTRDGWPAFHPAAVPAKAGLQRWFKVWCEWLAEPSLAVMADLLTLPETGVLIGGRRAQKSQRLAAMRARWMVLHTDDLQRRIDAAPFRSDADKASAVEVLHAVLLLEKLRLGFLRDDFSATLTSLLDSLALGNPAAAGMAATLGEWMAQAAPVVGRVKRGARFWLDLMLDEVPAPATPAPAGRVIDVQGWLELYYEPGRHLVMCGINEGKVPARNSGAPWLSETGRERLGLLTDAMRAARDAFLFKAMVAARHADGRVDVICGKTGAGGETLLPSRLLLTTERSALPSRVTTLFCEIEPPEAGLRWHADWQWQVRRADPPKRISVTSIRDYLACPFRYYLKHVIGMQVPETARVEWNARDFGTVAHEVLECWGKDVEAREFDKSETLSAWLSAELDRVVTAAFGKRVPMAVRIQTESLRQRLTWLARIQAGERAAGWQVVDVERKVEIPVGDAMLVAKIDRIDRHRESGELRVIDYKTGKVDTVEKEHRSKIIASSVPAPHLTDSPALHAGVANGKPVIYRWKNLQLPLYAAALVRRGEVMPRPCYFALGATAGDVAIEQWADFSQADLDAAEACAAWVVGNIANHVFTPPVEKVSYDDYSILAAGRTLQQAVAFAAPGMEA
jgi:ATP-dependent helicase/nuclease subunit B